MKTTIQKVYQCEHCNRKMLGASAMSVHEKYCQNNPNNRHKCFEYCVHLEKTTESIGDEWEGYSHITHMTCKKLNKEMYSYKFEKKRSTKPEYFKGLERMPLSCDNYKDIEALEFPKSINIF